MKHNPELHVPGFFVERIKMSITGSQSKRTDEEKLELEKAMKEFLKKGGKVKKIPEGEFTEAKDMKYKFRKPAKTKK